MSQMIITEPGSTRSGALTRGREPIRIGFVMHVMQVAGAEVLVARIIRELRGRIDPVIFCLDRVGPLGEQLQADGIDVVCLNRKPGRDWGLVSRFADALRQRRIEVLHAHQYTPFFYSALARWWGGSQARIVFTEHGRHYPDKVSPLRHWGNRILFSRLADRTNACCRFSADALRRIDGFRCHPVDVVYNGIDVADFAPVADRETLRARLGLVAGRRYLATVARFHPVKDHATLLRAFRQIALAQSDVDLLLVGDGPLRSELEQLVDSYGLQSRVQFWGVREDVPQILAATDVFVLPSLSEAASLTLLEAMACECPVVVTDVGGNPEIVRHGQDGFRVGRQDHDAMAKACLQILEDSSLARSMGSSGRERVLAQFQQHDTVQQFATLYEELSTGKQQDPVRQHS